jgi:hypothetical protein
VAKKYAGLAQRTLSWFESKPGIHVTFSDDPIGHP